MFTRQKRRRFGYINEGEKPRTFSRFILIGVILLIAWWSSEKIGHIFETASGQRNAVYLGIDEGQTGIQVALQNEEWQKGENSLKLYAGDKVRTGSVGEATLTFFDGTILCLDQNSEVIISENTKRIGSTSTIEGMLSKGRIWISSPEKTASGSVLRTIRTDNFSVTIKETTNALLAAESLFVIKEPSEGMQVTLLSKPKMSFFIGEGQGWKLDSEARGKIAAGESPYSYRDPLPLSTLQDAFITRSISAVERERAKMIISTTTSTQNSVIDATKKFLTILSPMDGEKITTNTIIVRGTVAPGVAQITVNGSNISTGTDLSFSAQVKMQEKDKMLLHIEAMNAEGIILAKEDRTVINAVEPPSFPAVKILAPVGSGQILKTNETSIEIAGETAEGTTAIVVNDYNLQLFKKGKKTWSYLANTELGNLRTGKNIFTIYAIGPDNVKSAKRSITVELSDAPVKVGSGTVTPALKQNAPLFPGSLKIVKPSSGTESTTSDSELSLIGETGAETASISVNGYTLSLFQENSTSWKYIASIERGTMKRGSNVYRIVARNAKGEILDVLEYTLNFVP